MKLFLAFLLIAGAAAKYEGPTNQAGLDLIKYFEGFYPDFYTDPVGITTIGYGHACHVNDCSVPLNGKYWVPLTLADGESLLQDDLASGYEDCVANYVTYSGLNADQFSALVSFTFNLGCGSLQTSSLVDYLNAGDVQRASTEFGRWVYAGGDILPGLVTRRAEENILFCKGTCIEYCTGTTTDPLNMRTQPDTTAPVVATIPAGWTIIITGRVQGDVINGNSNWFKLQYGSSTGYVSAYYANMKHNNGQSYCAK